MEKKPKETPISQTSLDEDRIISIAKDNPDIIDTHYKDIPDILSSDKAVSLADVHVTPAKVKIKSIIDRWIFV